MSNNFPWHPNSIMPEIAARHMPAKRVHPARRAAILVVAFLLFWGGGTSIGFAQEAPAGLDAFVRQTLADYEVPGASVVVVQDGKIVFLKGFGVRQVGHPEQVDEHTLFMLASVTKTFTAGLVGTLVDEGKLGWDDPVINHLPQMQLYDAYATRHVTCRDFLAHRSGLPAFTGDLLEKQGYSRAEILRRLRYLEPACSFREEAGYSNPGFLIAGLTAAEAGGASWDDLMKTRLLKPLGMTNSGTTQSDWKNTENYAAAHVVSGDELKVVEWENHDAMGPAGSITSTAADLAPWMLVHLNQGRLNNKVIFSPETVQQMHKPTMVETPGFAEAPPIRDDNGFSYGLGWNVYYYQGHKIVEKGGARAGMRSVVTLIPDKNVGVAVLANRNLTFLPEAIRAWVLDHYLEAPSSDIQQEIRNTGLALDKAFSMPPIGTAHALTAPQLPLSRYCGDYENALYGRLSIVETESGLRWVTGPARLGGPMQPAGYDNFLLHFPEGNIMLPEPVCFTINENGQPDRLITESFGTFRRVAD